MTAGGSDCCSLYGMRKRKCGCTLQENSAGMSKLRNCSCHRHSPGRLHRAPGGHRTGFLGSAGDAGAVHAPATLAGVAVGVTTVAMLACDLPARRPMPVDPAVALRYE